MLLVKKYSKACQTADVNVHEELVWVRSVIESLQAQWFIMYKNVSGSKTEKNLNSQYTDDSGHYDIGWYLKITRFSSRQFIMLESVNSALIFQHKWIVNLFSAKLVTLLIHTRLGQINASMSTW